MTWFTWAAVLWLPLAILLAAALGTAMDRMGHAPHPPRRLHVVPRDPAARP